MRRTHIKQRICLLFGCLLFLSWQGALGHERDRPRSKPGAVLVAYCDLVNNPEKYDGKEVTVRATYRYGFEWQEIFCLECRKVGKTWLEFDDDAAAQYKAALKKFPKHQGTVNAVFAGIFQSSKGPFGDGGYRFRFVVKGINSEEFSLKADGILNTCHPPYGRKFAVLNLPGLSRLLVLRDIGRDPIDDVLLLAAREL